MVHQFNCDIFFYYLSDIYGLPNVLFLINITDNNKMLNSNTTLRITTLSRWSSLCASVILRAMPAGIRVSLVGLTMPDWSRVRFQTKSDPWSSRLGVGRQANNLLP